MWVDCTLTTPRGRVIARGWEAVGILLIQFSLMALMPLLMIISAIIVVGCPNDPILACQLPDWLIIAALLVGATIVAGWDYGAFLHRVQELDRDP